MYNLGLKYRTLNTYRSALSAFHNNGEAIATGKHPLVTNLMKGIGNLCPPMPRYNFIWDVEIVQNYFDSCPENENLTLKNLTLKLAMLLSLAALKRGSEIRCLDVSALAKSEKKYVLKVLHSAKTSKPQNQQNQSQILCFMLFQDM